LKLICGILTWNNKEVAPRRGAWIETRIVPAFREIAKSRAPPGRVD